MLNLQSQRGLFAHCLHNEMAKNKNIWLIAIDLGYGILNTHFYDFPERCLNTGAAEQSALDTAVGLTLAGRRVFVYSITPFLLYRPFETIRTYINGENLPIQMIGSGRDKSYEHDGLSHWCEDARSILKPLKKVKTYWPIGLGEIPTIVTKMATTKSPSFISLTR